MTSVSGTVSYTHLDVYKRQVHITGLSTSASAVIVAPRKAENIKSAVASEPSLTVTPSKFEMAAGLVGKSSEFRRALVGSWNS